MPTDPHLDVSEAVRVQILASMTVSASCGRSTMSGQTPSQSFAGCCSPSTNGAPATGSL